jgi:hypothetical protein
MTGRISSPFKFDDCQVDLIQDIRSPQQSLLSVPICKVWKRIKKPEPQIKSSRPTWAMYQDPVSKTIKGKKRLMS